MSPSTVAVVGGGVSGLAAAWALAATGRARVVVLEASARTGGALRRARLGTGGPVVDVGAEALLARRPEGLDLARAAGLGADLVTPATSRAAVASRGALHPMPAGTLMGVPSDPGTLAGLLTDEEVQRVRQERLTAPLEADADVATWVASRLGPAVVDRLVEPLLGGVYAGRAGELSLRACLPGLWPAARDGAPALTAVATAVAGAVAAAGSSRQGTSRQGTSRQGTPSHAVPPPAPVFAGVRGGVGRLAEALTAALVTAGVAVRCGAPVLDLARAGGAAGGARWRLRLPAEVLDVDAVVLALPPAPAAALLAGAAPGAAAALATVVTSSLALATLLLAPGTLDAVGAESGAGALSGLLVPPVEGRVVKAMTFSSRKWGWVGEAAGGADVLRLSVGRRGEEEVLALDDTALLAAATADAAGLLGVDLEPRAALVTRWDDALPQYRPGHLDLVAAVRAEVADQPGLAVAGATYDGVGVPACVASAGAAASAVLAAVDG